jgi:uncharacterized membrane protein YgcG
MGASYKLEETRLVQERTNTSAANDEQLTIGDPGPPEGKLWIVIAAGYMPSVAETQTICWLKSTRPGTTLSVLNPISMLLNPGRSTCIEQGMEYMLLPKEFFIVRRAAHTAASTMTAYIQFIEIDQPLYTYEEPQVVKRQHRALSTLRTALGGVGSRGGGGGREPGGGREGGGGGRGLPI